MVTVSSATSTGPTVFPLMPCGSPTGDTITLGCLATGFMPSTLSYAWSKSGAALTDFIQYPPVLKGNVYTGVSQIRVKTQDWDASEPLQCSVTHVAGVTQAAFIQPVALEVTYELPAVSVLASYDKENNASFSCFAKDFSPNEYQIKWLRNDEDIISNKIYEVKTPSQKREDENGITLYTAASFLMVESSEWTRDTTLTCQFEGKGENGATFVNSSITYEVPRKAEGCPESDVDINIIGPTMEDMFLHQEGVIECRVRENSPSVRNILWEDQDGNEIVASRKTPKNNKGETTISLEVSYNEWSRGLDLFCVVEHTELVERLKKPYRRNNGGQLQRPSVFMLPPVEHTKKEMVTLACYVKDFFPHEVFVSWLVDDEEADSNYHFHTTNPVKNGGSYSAYGQLLLSLEQWKKDDVVYSCVVHHESVATVTRAIVRSFGNRMLDKTTMVNLNMNVPDTCKA